MLLSPAAGFVAGSLLATDEEGAVVEVAGVFSAEPPAPQPASRVEIRVRARTPEVVFSSEYHPFGFMIHFAFEQGMATSRFLSMLLFYQGN